MGGSTKVVTPEPPAPPSTAGSTREWAESLPLVYQTQLQYMPAFSQMAKNINAQLYPETEGLQENLATQAAQGMTSNVPDWMKEEYQSNMRSQLGTNVSSPIGADYMSRGLLQQKMDWQNMYRQLGLAVSGKQQLVQSPSYSDMYGGYTPAANMGFNAQTYSPYASAGASMYGSQAGLMGQQYASNMGLAQSGLNTLGGLAALKMI